MSYQIYQLGKGNGMIKFRAKDLGFDPAVMKSLVAIAWPASLQFIIGSGSWILLTRLVAEIGGTAASAGYQIAFRNFVFFILPAWGLSNAAATLVGQNLGAKRFERAEQSVLTTTKYSALLMGVVTAILVLFAGSIIGVFTQDSLVLEHGTQALRIIGSGFVFYAVAMVMTQALNGAGDTKTPTRLNVICFWVFQTPFAYWLANKTELRAAGAMAAIPAAQALLAIFAWWYFKRGRWKEIRI